MKEPEELKNTVRSKYADIVKEKKSCCCGNTAKDSSESVFNESYKNKEGYLEEADLFLGCGIPTDYADINQGDHVLDLGCGAGNDCFVARQLTGDSGRVTGLDFTTEMLDKARDNNKKLGYSNIEFTLGDIENMPFQDNQFDVVISNCVLNLVPDKTKAFSEIKRVLKPGGHFCISDIVLKGQLTQSIRDAATLYAGCVSGALQMDDYIGIIQDTEFTNIDLIKERAIYVPDSMLLEEVSIEEIEKFRHSGTGIFSITVTGNK